MVVYMPAVKIIILQSRSCVVDCYCSSECPISLPLCLGSAFASSIWSCLGTTVFRSNFFQILRLTTAYFPHIVINFFTAPWTWPNVQHLCQ